MSRRRTPGEVRNADELGLERRDAGAGGADAGYAFGVRTQIELRTKEGAKMPGLRGYTAVFNSRSEPLGFFEDFIEFIAPGAFAKTIVESDIRALFNHDANFIFGRSRGGTGGTLALSEDSEGLEFEVDELPNSTVGRDLAENVEREDVDGCSFGFRTIQDSWNYEVSTEDRERGIEAYRTLEEVRLFDVGPVVYPAYPETTAEIRSKIAGLRAHRDAITDGTPWLKSYGHRLAELDERGAVHLG